jgi:hypothetical protein
MKPQMNKEQEALLDKALQYAQLAEQQARELLELGEAFAVKWEQRLHDAEVAEVSKVDN